jgi:glycosyltransferase involved in cell wall biosynthesis
MPYRLIEVELSQPIPPITLSAEEDGAAVVARWRDELVGFEMHEAPPGATLSPADLVGERTLRRVLSAKAAAEFERLWAVADPALAPSLTIAICTKDRAVRLQRLLASLDAVCADSPFAQTEVLVVDNAPSDEATREAAARFARVRYLREPKAGLDFARNGALHAARGDLLAFLDDDVVVDRGWLNGLFAAWRGCPEAGGFTGLVLPFSLDTEARIEFQGRGGFGRGFNRIEFRGAMWGKRHYPVGTGELGAGCNMCFDRSLLLQLGGFDEALDTGAPLPGGGDLDIFYRVLRAGRTMVYEPQYAVYHEHRETIPQLRRQYWSWGLGFMAFLDKSRRDDPALRGKQAGMARWWWLDKLAAISVALAGRRRRSLAFEFAEAWGGLIGLAGEYDRSRARVRKIRERSA